MGAGHRAAGCAALCACCCAIPTFAAGGECCDLAESQRAGAIAPSFPAPQSEWSVEWMRPGHQHDTRADDMNAQNSSRLTVHTPSMRVIVPVWSE